MATSYDLSVGALPEEERRRVDEILREWSSTRPVGRTIADNLKKEHFLPKECMDDLLRCVIDHGAAEFASLEPTYEDACHSHVLRGGPIETEHPGRVGRVVPVDSLVDIMIDYGVGTYFADIDAAEAFVATPTERRAATLAGLAAPPTDYAAWVTWDFDEPTEPFAFASGKDADWVCGCLGLDPRRVSRPVALLEYAAPPGLCRPTVADAGLNTNFSPPIAGEERCGFTRPLDDAVRLPPPLEDTVEDNVMPRPEALHHSLRTDEVDLEWEVKL